MFKFKNITFLVFIILMCSLAIQPSNFIYEKIEVDVVSEKDIFAPKSTSYIDEQATQQLKQEALSQVQDVYDHDKNVYIVLQDDMSRFLKSLLEKKDIIDKTISSERDNEAFKVEKFIDSELNSLDNPFGFNTTELKTFMATDYSDLKRYTDQLLKVLKPILYDRGVTEEQLDSSKRDFERSADSITYSSSRRIDAISAVLIEKLSSRIVVNFLLNTEETSLRKKEAESKVEPVYKQVKKGELIIGKGQLVTVEHKEKLKQLGLTDNKFQYKDFLYQIPYVALILSFFHLFCFKFYRDEFESFRKYSFILVSIFFLMLSSNFIDELRYFLIPLIVIMMISTIVWGRKFILSFSAILGFLLYSGEFVYSATTIITGLTLALHYKHGGDRMELIKTGILLGFVFVLSQFVFKFSIDKDLMSLSFGFLNNMWFLVSTFFASIVTLGIIPLVEKFLSIVTYFRLHEYNKPTHPLIKKLIIEAPGTYDHSVKVGNLAELAADAIGADSLLVRVAAYYHDVGKTIHPEYFIENSSPGSNPHNDLSPLESAKIILSHPIDSVRLCKEHKLPQSIIDLVASHHSDSVLSHIYRKAKEIDEEANITDFKYNCPTPKTKEEGILMLADSTEAYSRVLLEKTLSKEELEQALRKSIYEKISNGDLRDCSLTFDELETIISTFVNYLSKSNHKRISYKNEDKTNNG